MPSAEARRRILAGEPSGTGAGQSAGAHARGGAAARRLPARARRRRRTRWSTLATQHTEAEQNENTLSLRLDHRFTNTHSFYARYLFSNGDIDTPDRTVTARRVRAEAEAAELRGQLPEHVRRLGRQRVQGRLQQAADERGGVRHRAGYDPVGVSLSGTVTSSSIDARGTTGIARSGLLIRATSASSTTGSVFDPRSLSFSDALTWTQGRAHFKFGGEYRTHPVGLPVPGQHGNHLQQRHGLHRQPPAAVAVALDSPVFKPQQYLRDWLRAGLVARDRPADARARPALRLLLGGEGSQRQREAVLHRGERVRARDPRQLLQRRQEQLLAAPVGGVSARRQDGRAAAASACSTARASSKIASSRSRTTSSAAACSTADVPNNGLQYPFSERSLATTLSIRGYTHERPDEYNMQYGVSVSRELPGDDQPDGRLHRQPGQGHVPARRRQHARPVTRAPAGADLRPDRLQDVRLRRRPGDQRPADLTAAATPATTRCRSARRAASAAA